MIAFHPLASMAWPEWPDYALVDDLLPAIRAFAADGDVALATLVSVEHSSPRPVGSEMAIAADGRVAGYVSGGCVEAAVAVEALAALSDGAPRLLDYGVGSPVLDIQLTCGGRIGIFVRKLFGAHRYVGALSDARRDRRAVTVLTDRRDGSWWIESGLRAADDRHYARVFEPRLRVVVVGNDPATLALARLAPQMGIEVILLRPHGPTHPPPDTPLAAYDCRSLRTALAGLVIDPWTAFYSLAHDAEIDHEVIVHALRSSAFAIGALGSRQKIAGRLARLQGEGIAEHELGRLRLPAGLAIGAQTPQGIALSVLAELCQMDRARRP